MKTIFETDCKICFCTESDDKNPVLYCDSCNASFHQACYGVEKITEDKFYCDVCLFLKEMKALKEKEEKDAKEAKEMKEENDANEEGKGGKEGK